MSSTIDNSPYPPSEDEETSFHFQDYLFVILRRWKLILLVFLAVYFGYTYYGFYQKPVYEAFTTLQVQSVGKSNSLLDMGMGSGNSLATDIQMLKSRNIAEKVAEKLHLNWNVRYVPPAPESLSLKDKILHQVDGFIDVSSLFQRNGRRDAQKPKLGVTEFSSKSPGSAYNLRLNGSGAFEVLDDAGNLLGNGHVGDHFQNGHLSLSIESAVGKPGDLFSLSQAPLHMVGEQLQRDIQVAEIGERTSVLKITYRSTNPIRAQDVLNILTQAYQEQSVEIKTREATKTAEFIDRQIDALRESLDGSEKELLEYQLNSGLKVLGPEANLLVQKLVELGAKKTEVDLKKKRIKFARDSLNQALTTGKSYVPEDMEGRASLAEQVSHLTDLSMQKQALLVKFTPSHPEVHKVNDQIKSLERKIQSAFQSALEDLEWETAQLNALEKDYDKELNRLSPAELNLARLMRISKVNVEIYTFLLQKREEANIARAATVSNINVVDPAIVPTWPIHPNKGKVRKTGLMIGLVLSLGLAFLLEYADNTLKDVDKAKQIFQYPVLASIPHISLTGKKKNGSATTQLVTRDHLKSAVSEAFRALRTSIHFSSVSAEKKVQLVTSTFPEEGKSTISSNLAVTVCQTGSRVLLIGCDLRRPTLGKFFGIPRGSGLTEVLVGDETLDAVICASGVEGLDFMPSGAVPPNPAELLGSTRMKEVLQTLREKYDVILLDAPPLMAVTDAALLAQYSDMVLLVVEAGRIPIKVARRMRELLQSINAPVAGLIMNDKTRKGERYYGYYGKGRYYGSYYGYGYGYGYYSDDQKKKGGWFGKRKMR